MPDAIQTALIVALRHSDAATTTEQEREAVLIAIADIFSGERGELAAKSLHHLREQRRLQLTLRAILEGIGPKA